jgi:hypothetical protein
MWYDGSATAPAFFGQHVISGIMNIFSVKDQVQSHIGGMSYHEAWSTLPLRLLFYNYIRLNPHRWIVPE